MFAASKSGKPAAAGATTDPNFNSTTLLLETTGTNGQQNNTFLDSSTNNFTVTRTGTPTQGTFTPFSQTGWGGYFNGTTDYLTVAPATAIDLSTGDFTVEVWTYSIATTNAVDSCFGWGFYTMMLYHDATNWTLEVGNGTTNYFTISTAYTANTWVHFAVTRSGSTFTLWKNGISAGTGTTASAVAMASKTLYIGVNNGTEGSPQKLTGYMSNLRIVKGTAVYTAAFTPPTTPLTAISGTSLLTLQSNRFKDNSSNNFAITATGTPSIQAFSPFAPAAAYSTATVGGSGWFSGSGSYLTSSSTTSLNPLCTGGTSGITFTFESWVYPTATVTGANVWQGAPIVSKGATYFSFQVNNNKLRFYWYLTSPNNFDSTATIPLNVWTHVAATVVGSVITLYVNGVNSGVGTFTGIATAAQNTSENIAAQLATGQESVFPGYLSNVRIVNGTAVYTANFTPPTAPLTAITNTSLLLSATNSGIYDATSKNDISTISNAQASTVQSKFGGSSMLFNGTTDYLTAVDKPTLQLGTGDFTIEGWVYLTTGSTARGYLSKGPSAATTGWELRFNAANFLRFEWTASFLVGTTTIPTNTWTFVTVVRSGTATGNVKLYVNGALYATSSVAVTDNFNQTDPLRIGIDRAGAAFFPGYTDDIRITKGIARYTAAFTAPTAPFPVS